MDMWADASVNAKLLHDAFVSLSNQVEVLNDKKPSNWGWLQGMGNEDNESPSQWVMDDKARDWFRNA